MKKDMAYKSKGPGIPDRSESTVKPSEFPADAKNPPKVKPSMKHKEPAAQFKYPKDGEQSMAPDHKKKALPMQDAPPGVEGVNGGNSVSLPKGGGVGDSEV